MKQYSIFSIRKVFSELPLKKYSNICNYSIFNLLIKKKHISACLLALRFSHANIKFEIMICIKIAYLSNIHFF